MLLLAILCTMTNQVVELRKVHYDESGDIEIAHVPTKDQLADIFTKRLNDARFCYLRNELNIVDSGSLT